MGFRRSLRRTLRAGAQLHLHNGKWERREQAVPRMTRAKKEQLRSERRAAADRAQPMTPDRARRLEVLLGHSARGHR